MQRRRCVVVRQGHLIETRVLIAVVEAFLIAVVVVGCGGSGPGNIDGRDGERGAAATNEETTAPEGDRPATGTAREPAGLDVKVVTPGQAYVPAGFGEGSLWATDLATCNDTGSASTSAGSASSSAAACALPAKTLLKKLDPQTGEEVAAIPLKDFSANITEVAFGAGSVWVSSGDYYPGPVGRRQPGDVMLRVDPRTNRVVDRIPVDSPSGLAFGHGSVWVTSAAYGTVSRIDPQTGEVVAKIEVGRGAVDIAVDESSGAVWVAGLDLSEDYVEYDPPKYSEDRKLSRVDPATNRVVAEIPIRAGSPDGGAQSVAVGKSEVWAQSVDGRLFKVNPATNEVAAMVSLGEWSSHLAVFRGAVWATFQAYSAGTGEQLVRVDPRTEHVVASEDIGPVSRVGYGRLVAGGGYVWFASRGGLARVTL
jgi:DNA-binding beta-propeller fold protein YncE